MNNKTYFDLCKCHHTGGGEQTQHRDNGTGYCLAYDCGGFKATADAIGFDAQFIAFFTERFTAPIHGDYFHQWVDRINSTQPTGYMDSDTLRIYKKVYG